MLYRRILAIDPNHANTVHYLGVLAHQIGRNDAAVELIERAISLDDRVPDFRYNLGIVFEVLGRRPDAAMQYRKATALKSDHAGAYQNLGNVLLGLDELEDAEVACRRALALNPRSAETQYNLGLVLARQNRYDDAIVQFRGVLRLRPDFVAADGSLGTALVAKGEFEQAAPHCRRAFDHDPRNAAMAINLALIGLAQGDVARALEAALDAIGIVESAQAKSLFARCARQVRATSDDARFRDLVFRALAEGWDRPSNLMLPALSLVRLNAALQAAIERRAVSAPRRLSIDELCGPSGLSELAKDKLLGLLLQSMPLCDGDIERSLAELRRGALDLALGLVGVGDDVLRFLCALARQCFINEYVYAVDDDERRRVATLRGTLETALRSGGDVSPSAIAVLACYLPLDSWDCGDLLSGRAWPAPVAAVVNQQITEPRLERDLRATLPNLTMIDDRVSIEVKRQYEENPYPRWVATGRAPAPTTIDAHLNGLFPRGGFKPLGKNKIDVLIAGCGTGQHAIETAQRYLDVDMLAIDLSVASLGYAMRKSRELGLTNIRYAVADILEIDMLDGGFDLIEASGVLHHLADPMAAWRRLLAVLRPGGVMNVGLYSELARQDVVRARAFIAECGYPATADGIRACRQQLMARSDDPLLHDVCQRADFFSASGCRDLLFHVQEHRLTLPQIAAFLRDNGLAFLGFEADGMLFRQYAARFASDAAKTDLASWHQFETENPHSFAGMYQFWVQKT